MHVTSLFKIFSIVPTREIFLFSILTALQLKFLDYYEFIVNYDVP